MEKLHGAGREDRMEALSYYEIVVMSKEQIHWLVPSHLYALGLRDYLIIIPIPHRNTFSFRTHFLKVKNILPEVPVKLMMMI